MRSRPFNRRHQRRQVDHQALVREEQLGECRKTELTQTEGYLGSSAITLTSVEVHESPVPFDDKMIAPQIKSNATPPTSHPMTTTLLTTLFMPSSTLSVAMQFEGPCPRPQVSQVFSQKDVTLGRRLKGSNHFYESFIRTTTTTAHKINNQPLQDFLDEQLSRQYNFNQAINPSILQFRELYHDHNQPKSTDDNAIKHANLRK